MIVWDAEFLMCYFGTWKPDFFVRRYHVQPDGNKPVSAWLKMAVRYYIVRTARTNERMVSSFLLNDAWHLIAGTSIPDESSEVHMLVPPR